MVWTTLYDPALYIAHLVQFLYVLAASIGTNIALGTAASQGAIFAQNAGKWITANYSMTLATNLTATSKHCFPWKLQDTNRLSDIDRSSGVSHMEGQETKHAISTFQHTLAPAEGRDRVWRHILSDGDCCAHYVRFQVQRGIRPS